MIIAIPSYNRASLLVTNLLLPEAIIVIPKSQEESYKNAGHKNLVTIHDSQDGNISKKRNAILSLFGDRDDIVMLDDDITGFFELKGGKLAEISPKDTIKMFQKVLGRMEEENAMLGGIYPIANAFYMDENVKSAFIIGSCMIFRKNGCTRFNETLMAKEDYDMTIRQWTTYGKVCRFNRYTHKKKEYIGQGGVAEQRTVRNIDREACYFLLQRYPKYVRLNKKRPDQILLTLK